ncbi:hypothetical protein NEMBOFW57_002854 [Staphylotrichum longicolle]|uniref:Uncharacterized protein n=1 Tax=Staphylotrichum longicolle TaxID=669026 RepID=A0AAD4F4J7_9PEZI|nr:hypothetical protein NEMBOFW57_002854 [Staphylotrichum longicolle]
MAPSPKSFLIFDAVLIVDMMQNLALKAISALNWLACWTPKGPRDRMALDGDSTCYYPPTEEEKSDVAQPVEFLNSQGPNSATITELPGWRIIPWPATPLHHPAHPETLHRLLDTFDRALAHTRYAICGHAALMVWGYRSTTTTTTPPPPPRRRARL